MDAISFGFILSLSQQTWTFITLIPDEHFRLVLFCLAFSWSYIF